MSDVDDEITRACQTSMIRHLDGVPNEELRGLIEEWRNAAKGGMEKSGKTVALTFAEELEVLIED